MGAGVSEKANSLRHHGIKSLTIQPRFCAANLRQNLVADPYLLFHLFPVGEAASGAVFKSVYKVA
jgi:hypothetical protein